MDRTQILSQMLLDRHDIHKCPELGWLEFETSYYVYERLEPLGFRMHLAPEMIHKESVQGRDEAEVKKAMERTLKSGVPQSFIDATEGYTGLVAEWDTGRPGKALVLRLDLDALPIQESKESTHEAVAGGYASEFNFDARLRP